MNGSGPRGFRVLTAAYTVSHLGSAMSLVALPIVVFRLTGSAVQTGALAMIEVLPYLVLGLFAGTVADRFPGRVLPAVADVVSAAAFGVLAVLLAAGTPPIWVFYLTALVGSVSFVFHTAALPALSRLLRGRDGIVKASSVLSLSDTLTAIAGSALAAPLVAVAPTPTVFALDAVSFLASGLLISVIRVPPPPAAGAAGGRARWRGDMRAGVRFFWTQRDLRNTILAGLGMVVTGGALLSMLAPLAAQSYGAVGQEWRTALLYMAGDAGSAVVAAVFPLLTRRSSAGRLAAYGMCGNGVLFFALVSTSTWGLALPLMAGWQFTYTLVILNSGVIRQMLTPVALLGRVSTLGRMLAWGGQPVGAAAVSILSVHMSVRGGLQWCGAGVVLGLAFAVAAKVTSIDVRDAADPDEVPSAKTGPAVPERA